MKIFRKNEFSHLPLFSFRCHFAKLPFSKKTKKYRLMANIFDRYWPASNILSWIRATAYWKNRHCFQSNLFQAHHTDPFSLQAKCSSGNISSNLHLIPILCLFLSLNFSISLNSFSLLFPFFLFFPFFCFSISTFRSLKSSLSYSISLRQSKGNVSAYLYTWVSLFFPQWKKFNIALDSKTFRNEKIVNG